MRKLIWVSGLALALAMPAMAQDETPRVEASAGYSYVRANVKVSATGIGSASQGFNVNGGSGSLALNLNHWLGAVADFGGYHTTQSATFGGTSASGDATFYTYLFGPRINSRHGLLHLYGQALFGGAHGTVSASSAGTPIGSASKNVFAFTAGGGAAVKLGQHFSVFGQPEYLYTNFTAHNTVAGTTITVPHQNNLRLTVGIMFAFGGK